MVAISVGEIVLVLALIAIAGIVLTVVSALLGFLPAIIAAAVVYFVFGHSLLYAAVAFVVVAFVWALVKRR